MSNKVTGLINYKLNKLESKINNDKTIDEIGQATKDYMDAVEKLKRDLSKDSKQAYRDLARYISQEAINIPNEPIFDWKRRKSTL